MPHSLNVEKCSSHDYHRIHVRFKKKAIVIIVIVVIWIIVVVIVRKLRQEIKRPKSLKRLKVKNFDGFGDFSPHFVYLFLRTNFLGWN